jgi:hypothetical protein
VRGLLAGPARFGCAVERAGQSQSAPGPGKRLVEAGG